MEPSVSSPRELVEKTSDLFSLPDVYFRVKFVMDSPNSGLMDIAREIAIDPGLTARLLRIANSAFFGLTAKIDTVERAVNLLGMQQVHDLVLATSVSAAFEDIDQQHIDMRAFWENSVYSGIISRLLALRCNVIDSERLFVEGLLRDIGHLVMYQCIPKQTLQARLFADQEGTPLYLNEREIIGFDYAQVGAELMRAWQLPEGMRETVEFHNEPDQVNGYLLEVAIAHISARVVALYNSESPDITSLNIASHALNITCLSLEAIENIADEARSHVDQTMRLLIGNVATG